MDDSKNKNELTIYNDLKKESADLIDQIIKCRDLGQTKDLTYLFNLNQLKKNLVQLDKYSDLMDVLTRQAIKRIVDHPDEIETKQLFDALKIIQDLIERSSNMVNGKTNPEVPDTLIQINKTEINVDSKKSDLESLDRTSRKKVEDFVLSVLNVSKSNEPSDQVIIDAEEIKPSDDGDDNHE